MSRLQTKTLSALGALAFLLTYHILPVSAQSAALGTQGPARTSAARTYAQFDEQRGSTSALAGPAVSEQKAPWRDVIISHKIGGCGLLCQAGIAE